MNQVRLSPQMMRQRSKEYLNEHDKMEEIIKRLDYLMQLLLSEWEGQASKAFHAQYITLKPNFVQLSTLISTIAQQVGQTANAMQQLDEEIASKLR